MRFVHYQWKLASNMPHTADAVLMTQAISNFFVSEARKSQHGVGDEETIEKMLVYNTDPTYVGKDMWTTSSFDQAYFIPASPGAASKAAGSSN